MYMATVLLQGLNTFTSFSTLVKVWYKKKVFGK